MSAAPAARLLWKRPDGEEVVFTLDQRAVTVGRDEMAEVFIDEVLVSRGHARLERVGDDWVVKDLGSTNGTRVNGTLVREQRLEDGDELRFARAVCVFRR